ncbi:hypothetical protein [Nocardia xishanensis]
MNRYSATPSRDEPYVEGIGIVEGEEGELSRPEFEGAVQWIEDMREALYSEPEVREAMEYLNSITNPDGTMEPPHQGVH